MKIKCYCTLEFCALHTAVMAPSPCSLMILTILFTARKREFHLVSSGLKSWSLHFSIISAAAVDLPLLFRRLQCFEEAGQESFVLSTPSLGGGRHSDDALAVDIPDHHLHPTWLQLQQTQDPHCFPLH